MIKDLTTEMIEISEVAHGVDVQVSADRNKLWLNIDGVCRVRIQGIKGRFRFVDDSISTETVDQLADMLIAFISNDPVERIEGLNATAQFLHDLQRNKDWEEPN